MPNQHFFKPLLPGFHTHLTIPLAFFLKNIKGRNKKNTAKLRSDASEISWEVKIDDKRLTDGWKEFALAHDLRIGDILIFRQEQDKMSFHVTIFGPSCCEIQYESCLDDKINLEKIERNKNKKKKQKQKNPKREADSSSSSLDPSCFVATLTSSTLRFDTLYLPKSFVMANDIDTRSGEIVLMNENGESWSLPLKQKKLCGTVFINGGWRSFCNANGLKAGDIFTFKLIKRGGTQVLSLYSKDECSEEAKEVESLDTDPESDKESSQDERILHEYSRRKKKKGGGTLNLTLSSKESKDECLGEAKEVESLSTESESDKESSQEERILRECSRRKKKKGRSIWKASSSPSQNRFVTLTLKPYNIKNSKLNLPMPFTRTNGINEETKMSLLDKHGVKWSTNLRAENRSTRLRLLGGWKDFFKANCVKTGESVVLKLIWEEDTSCVLKFCSKVKDTGF